MGNVGVAGCKPLTTWLAGDWLFFDRRFLWELKVRLSTFLLSQLYLEKGWDKPVDKSVIKLWKDGSERRSYWPLALSTLTVRSSLPGPAAWTRGPGQAKNFCWTRAGPVDSGFQPFALAPKDCGPACG